MRELLEIAKQAALDAGAEIMKIYTDPAQDFGIEKKSDNSSLTLADKAAHLCIMRYLQSTGIPVLSEEGQHLPYEVRREWNRLWVVDPLDGTKEFIKKNGEFTVNIALVEDGTPILGVIYIPVTNVLYYGIVGEGAWKITPSSLPEGSASMIESLPLKKSDERPFTVVASRSLMNAETEEYISQLQKNHDNIQLISSGSSIKICLVTEGAADVYPRFAPTMEWDTAAGDAIARAAGKQVLDVQTGTPLVYNKADLHNPWFLVEQKKKKNIQINHMTAILLLYCPDQQGIISEVTKFITDNKGNIVYLDQYVDKVEGMFFMRIEWELEGFLIPRDKIYDYLTTLYSQRFQMKFSLYYSDKRPRMAIFVSKMSHCLYDLLARWKAGEFNCDIPCIISNHEDLRYVADQFDIPYYVWSIKKDHSNKAEVEAAEMELLRKEDVSFIVLARYMQVISDDMIAQYPHHIINIHHSFLPAFVGAKPYHQAYERGVKIIGATSHYVTAELDAGPIIEQDVARITHKDTPQSLVLKGKDLEKIVLSRAVSKHIERKILTYKNKTIIFS